MEDIVPELPPIELLEEAENQKQVLSWLESQFEAYDKICKYKESSGITYFSLFPKVGMLFETLQTKLDLRYAELQASSESCFKNLSRELTHIDGEVSQMCHQTSGFEIDIKTFLSNLPKVEDTYIKNLWILTEIDCLRSRFSTCHTFLNILQHWNSTVNRLELNLERICQFPELCNGNNLSSHAESALSYEVPLEFNEDDVFLDCANQLTCLKDAASILNKIPRFISKSLWVADYEERFLNTCSSRLTHSIQNIPLSKLKLFFKIFSQLNTLNKLEITLENAYGACITQLVSSLWSELPNMQVHEGSSKISNSIDSEYFIGSPERDVYALQKDLSPINSTESLLQYYNEASTLLSKCHECLTETSQDCPFFDPSRVLVTLLKVSMNSPLDYLTTFLKRLQEEKRSDYQKNITYMIISMETGVQTLVETVISLNLDIDFVKNNNSELERNSLLASFTQNPYKTWWENFCLQHPYILFPKNLISSLSLLLTERITFLLSPPSTHKTSNASEILASFFNETQEILTQFVCFWETQLEQRSDPQKFVIVHEFHGAFGCPVALEIFDRLMEAYWTRWETTVLDIFSQVTETDSKTENGTPPAAKTDFPAPESAVLSTNFLKEETFECILNASHLAFWKQIRVFLSQRAFSEFLKCVEIMWRNCYEVWSDPLDCNVAARIALIHHIHSSSRLDYFIKLLKLEMFVLDQHQEDTPSITRRVSKICPLAFKRLTRLVSTYRSRLMQSALDVVSPILNKYSSSAVWCAQDTSRDCATPKLHSHPSNILVSVLEYLLSIIQFFDGNDEKHIENMELSVSLKHDLENLLKNIVSLYNNAVFQIPKVTEEGKNQLLIDIHYLKKTCLLLGHDPQGLMEIQEHVINNFHTTFA